MVRCSGGGASVDGANRIGSGGSSGSSSSRRGGGSVVGRVATIRKAMCSGKQEVFHVAQGGLDPDGQRVGGEGQGEGVCVGVAVGVGEWVVGMEACLSGTAGWWDYVCGEEAAGAGQQRDGAMARESQGRLRTASASKQRCIDCGGVAQKPAKAYQFKSKAVKPQGPPSETVRRLGG